MAAKDLVELLETAIKSDEFPEDETCLRTFLFDKLYTHEEAYNLFGLYIGLIKLHPDYSKEQLIKAVETKTLVDYIVKMHSDKYQSYYSKWFMEILDRFQ